MKKNKSSEGNFQRKKKERKRNDRIEISMDKIEDVHREIKKKRNKKNSVN